MTNKLGSILEKIDDATEPKVMSKREARDFLELLQCELECRIDALNEEMAEGE